MKTRHAPKGPWSHRLLIYSFTALFAFLVYWLLGFVLRDIGTLPGPEYRQVEKRLSDARTSEEAAKIASQIDDSKRAITNRQSRQSVLRDSTSNSEKTMNQLLELQKLTLQKGLTPSSDESKALAESQRLFLANQSKYQEMNDQIAALNEQLSDLQDRQREVQKILDTQLPAIRAEFDQLQARHNFKVASFKLAVLLPLLAVAVWLFIRKSASLYVWMFYGFGLALLLKVLQVMHEHFPTRYFKYILIGIALLLVVRILVYLLRAVAFPKLESLVKQYRDAYEHFFCPVCSHPIRRGPLKHRFWTRNSLKKLQIASPEPMPDDEPYTCPVCATPLFEECPSCKRVRHSLLPACVHCGVTREIRTPSA